MTTRQTITPAEKAFAFLAMLAACLPEGRYTADAGRWATAISALRDKYGTEYPQFFRYLHFRHAPRADSYSPEVSSFLGFLQFADATEVHNPGFTSMEFQPSARQLLRDRYQEFLDPNDRSAVEEMSREILDKIKVPA